MSATPHTIHIEGDLSIRSAESLAKELREGLAAHEALAIDAHALTSVDISIVQVLLAAHKSAQEHGRTLRIEGAAVGALGRALERSGLASAEGGPTEVPTVWEGDAWTGLHHLQSESAA